MVFKTPQPIASTLIGDTAMKKNIVVAPVATPEWLKKWGNVLSEIWRQLLLGLTEPSKGLTLEQLQLMVEHRDPFAMIIPFKNNRAATHGWTLEQDVPFDGKPFLVRAVEWTFQGEEESKDVLGQAHAEYFIENSDRIPVSWADDTDLELVIFPGTIWLDSAGVRHVPAFDPSENSKPGSSLHLQWVEMDAEYLGEMNKLLIARKKQK